MCPFYMSRDLHYGICVRHALVYSFFQNKGMFCREDATIGDEDGISEQENRLKSSRELKLLLRNKLRKNAG